MPVPTEGSLLFRKVPVLEKLPKRKAAVALPSALHIGFSSAVSVLILGVINAAVTLSLGPDKQWSKLVQSGTMMAMVTVCVLAMPTLGNSVAKAIQRITGVMVGGWLFYGLFAGCQAWWFLALCLALWAFVLVAASFLLTGNQYLSPVALITAFIVATSFDSVEKALEMTAVKTFAISGSIVLYMLLSMASFPITATQQVLTAIADALAELHQLAEQLLITGGRTGGAKADGRAGTSMAAEIVKGPHLPSVKDVDNTASVALAASQDTSAVAGVAVALGAAASDPGPSLGQSAVSADDCRASQAPAKDKAALLASSIAHNLQLAQQLLPATQRERFIGDLGAYRCFIPSIVNRGLDEGRCMAVVLSASQVLRSLLLMMNEYGDVPLAQRWMSPPRHLVGPEAEQLMSALAQHAVAALEELSQLLSATGQCTSTVSKHSLAAYSQTLEQLVASTAPGTGHPSTDAEHGRVSSGSKVYTDRVSQDPAATPASTASGRWKQAITVATGYGGVKPPLEGVDQIAAAFGHLLVDAVMSPEAQVSKWFSTLVLARQLGDALAGLQHTTIQMLPLVPGAQQTRESTHFREGCSMNSDIV